LPTYTVTYSNTSLSTTQLERIAQLITTTHSECTGANTYFAQVMFKETPIDHHYMGGKPVHDRQIFVHGHIRGDRGLEIKRELILSLREALAKGAGFAEDQIWIYISDLVPDQMMEYGHILPPSGKEREWFDDLPTDLQARLKSM
jgi:phenylpyruvate tautomerase PptA (4-oxalocrotonate tautomerase family)